MDLQQKLIEERRHTGARGEAAPSGKELQLLRRYTRDGVRSHREAVERNRLMLRYPLVHSALLGEALGEQEGPLPPSPFREDDCIQ